MKKKSITSILALIMVTSTIPCTACRSGSSNIVGEVKENELVVSTYEFSYGTEWLEACLDKFVATKEGVTYRLVPDNNIDTSMESAMSAGKNIADVYIPAGSNSRMMMIQKGYFADLSSVYDTEVQTSSGMRTIKDYMEDDVVNYYYTQQFVGQGELLPWIMPLGSITLSFAYNEDMLLATPHTTASSDGKWAVGDKWTAPPETMEEMLAYCTDLNARKITPFAWSGLAKHWLAYFMNVWFAQHQGVREPNLKNVGADDGCFSDFTNFTSAENWKMEGLQVAWETLQSLIIDTSNGKWKNSLSGVDSYDEQDAARHFVQQDTAMCFAGSFMYNENKDFMDLNGDGKDDFTMKMMPIPTVAGAEKNADGSAKKWSYRNLGEYVCVPKKATNLQLAKEFVAFMCSEECNRIFTDYTGTMRPFEYDPIEGSTKEFSDFEYTTLKLYRESEKISMIPLGIAKEDISPIAYWQNASIFGSISIENLYLRSNRNMTAEQLFITGKSGFDSVYEKTKPEYNKWLIQYGVL